MISLQSSAQAEGPSTRFLHPGPGEGLEKQGRIGRVKERTQRGKGREIKSFLFLTGWGTLASCPRQEETRDKRVPVAAAGSGPLAGKLAPEYPEWSGCQSW